VVLPKEYLSFRGIDERQWAAAVAYLRRRLRAVDRKRIAAEVAESGLDAWVVSNHFMVGMTVRNLLRRRGFNEARLGIMDLDSAWGYLLSEAIAPESEDRG
jgi:hypothetical protein